jgi:hypothetical protein
MRWLPLSLVCFPSLALAQLTLDLTGRPAASIDESFSSISGVQELSARLAVATDNMEAKVVVADFSRGTVKQVGRKGRGPNEYQYPSPPVRGPRGVYVFDTYQKRAIIIDAKGAIVDMETLPDASSLSRIRGSDGRRFYFEGSDFDPNTGRFSDSLPVVRWDPATNAVQQVSRVWGGGRVIIQRGDGRASLAREITPFPHLDAWAVLPGGGLALIRRDPFRIDMVSAAGAITRGAPIAHTPVALTARDRDWHRDRNTPGRVSAGMIGGGSGPQRAGSPWEDAHFPPTLPPFIAGDLVTTPEGEIWIPRSFASADKFRVYEIYDARGTLTGRARLNADSRVVGFGASSVYVARVDRDDDLVYLAKYAR